MRHILEVGTGSVPYFVRYEIPWLLGDRYTSIDVDETRIENAKQEVERLKKNGYSHPKDPEFLLGDAISLPLTDATFDEVVLSNILTAPIHHNWDHPGRYVTIKNKSGEYKRPLRVQKGKGDMFYGERKPVVTEARRVLRPGGTLSIYTDLLIYGQLSYEKIIEELTQDLSLVFQSDKKESGRIDALNQKKLQSDQFCFCFDADLLPESHVLRFTKIY